MPDSLPEGARIALAALLAVLACAAVLALLTLLDPALLASS